MSRRESALRDEAFTAVITAALDSIYATPVDLNTSLVDLQDRLAARPRTDHADHTDHAGHAIAPRPARRRISRPGFRVGGILIAAAAVFFLCVFFSAALAGTIIGPRTHSMPGRPDRGDSAAPTVPREGDGAISLSSLHPDTPRAARGPLVRSTLGNGQSIIKWVPNTSPGAGRTAAETFSYSSQGPATFSAELPSLASGLTASCKWTVQIQGQPARTYYTQPTAARPIDLSVTHPGAITITVALTQPGPSTPGCTMIQMPLPGQAAAPTGPADATQGTSPAATPYSTLWSTKPQPTSGADASPAPTPSPSTEPGATPSPTQSPSPAASPSPKPTSTGKT